VSVGELGTEALCRPYDSLSTDGCMQSDDPTGPDLQRRRLFEDLDATALDGLRQAASQPSRVHRGAVGRVDGAEHVGRADNRPCLAAAEQHQVVLAETK